MKRFALFPILFLLFIANPASAATQPTPVGTCTPIFGGGASCESSSNLLINKTIKHPVTNSFVDVLAPDTTFSPNQDITFRITVTNNNNAVLNKLTITDSLPQFMTFTEGQGTFDATNRKLTIGIDKLKGNETKSFTFSGRILGADSFPAEKPLTCLVNIAEVKAASRKSSDNVQYCVKTGEITMAPTASTTNSFPTTNTTTTLGTTTTKGNITVYPSPSSPTTPATGPELLGLIGLLPLGGIGYILRKKSLSH